MAQDLPEEKARPRVLPQVLAGRPTGAWGGYLMVPSLNVQNVPLGDRPVESETWYSIAKGEWVLAVGDPSDVDGHLWGERQACDNLCPSPSGPGSCLSPAWDACASCRSGPEHSQAPCRGGSSDKTAKDGVEDRTSPPVLKGPRQYGMVGARVLAEGAGGRAAGLEQMLHWPWAPSPASRDTFYVSPAPCALPSWGYKNPHRKAQSYSRRRPRCGR